MENAQYPLPDVSFGAPRWKEELHPQLRDAVEKDPPAVYRSLFAGRLGCVGVSRGSDCTTERGPLHAGHYARHLESDGTDGAWALGVNPLREDDLVSFAALDFDAEGLPEADALTLAHRSRELDLPLVFTRSRSGGVHGWLFMTEGCDPRVVRRVLSAWGEQLGWPAKAGGDSKATGARFYEVFPKHDSIPPEKPGNWIRLPYPGGDKAERRRGFWYRERPPTLVQWLSFAYQHRITPQQLNAYALTLASEPIATAATDSPVGTEVIAAAEGKSLPAGSRDPYVRLATAERWLRRLADDRCNDRDDWLRVLMSLHHQFAGTHDEPDAIRAAREWSQRSPKYRDEDVESAWKGFASTRSDAVTIRTLRHMAGVDVEERAIEELNRHYAHVLRGGNSILYTPDSGEPEFMELARWREHLGNQFIIIDGKERRAPEAWLRHPGRRSYFTIVFDPRSAPYADVSSRHGPSGARDFNLWPGIATTASPEGSCLRFLEHVRNRVCAGNEDHFRWLLHWLAHIVQRHHELAGTAVALRGRQGAGKSLVGEVFGCILGDRLYTKISRPGELTGRFNQHLQGRLLVQVEEGFWAGDKEAEGALKHMITSPVISIERKFADRVDLPNYARFLFTSNSRWVVPAGLSERRFAVFNVDGQSAADFEYFAAIRREMFDEGGCARLYYFLVNEVVVDWDNIRRPPRTEALLDQQLESLAPFDRWLLDILVEGELPGASSADGLVMKDNLFQSLQTTLSATGRGKHATKTLLTRYLRERLPDMVSDFRPAGETRIRYYRFGALKECRRKFAEQLGVTPEWSEAADWQAAGLLGVYP